MNDRITRPGSTKGHHGRRRWPLPAAAAIVLLLLSACVPSANVLTVPSFELAPERSGFVRIDPPGVGDGSAHFRLALTVTNPNAVGVNLAGLDGALYLRNVRAASVTFRGGVEVPARGAAPLLLDVRVPLGAAPELLDTIAGYIGGAATPFRLDAAVTIDVFGAPQRFPEFTLVRSELSAPSALRAPSAELLGSDLRFESVSSVTLTLRLGLTNPGIIGFVARLPEVRLTVAGAPAATAALPRVELPAGGRGEAELTFRFDPLALGAAVAAQVQAASAGLGGLSLGLSGGWSLEAPGIATVGLQPTTLLESVLR